MNKTNVRNKIILVSIISIAALFITILGLTYTWFNIILKNQDDTTGNVVVKAANLGTITFYSGEAISVTGAFPGWCETKKVSIKSEGATVKTNYSIYLNVVKNELAELGSTYGYITLQGKVVPQETRAITGETGSETLQDITQTNGIVTILSGKLGASDIHTYNIEFCFPELGLDQNSQQGKSFKGYLSVEAEAAEGDIEQCDEAVAFGTDSWETIACNVRSNNLSLYNVGDTKEIALDGYGTQTLRIANTSTPDECNTDGFSQSACGFVIEFEGIIARYNMNSSGLNVGGWPASEMYSFINGADETLYSAYTIDTSSRSSVKSVYMSLPEDLRSIIIDTKVISGHGSTASEENFTSTDKLYFLDSKEVYGTSFTSSSNTANDYERQLDYYFNQGVTTSNYSLAIKNYSGDAYSWWLRSAYYDADSVNVIQSVAVDGEKTNHWASSSYGVSPAFRIG